MQVFYVPAPSDRFGASFYMSVNIVLNWLHYLWLSQTDLPSKSHFSSIRLRDFKYLSCVLKFGSLPATRVSLTVPIQRRLDRLTQCRWLHNIKAAGSMPSLASDAWSQTTLRNRLRRYGYGIVLVLLMRPMIWLRVNLVSMLEAMQGGGELWRQSYQGKITLCLGSNRAPYRSNDFRSVLWLHFDLFQQQIPINCISVCPLQQFLTQRLLSRSCAFAITCFPGLHTTHSMFAASLISLHAHYSSSRSMHDL